MSPLALPTRSLSGLDAFLANPEFHERRAGWRHLGGWALPRRCPLRIDEGDARGAWGMLGALAGRLFADGEQVVRFDWSDDGDELHACFGNARGHVDRHVVITREGDGEFAFADAGHVHRGHGQASGDGSIWFYEAIPAHGCRESGAVYRMTPEGCFERQRHYTPRRGAGTVLEPARVYSVCDLYRLGV